MHKSNSKPNQGIAKESIEDIYQINRTCQACGKTLQDGVRVTAYALRPCPHAQWRIGQVRCADHPLSLSTQSTLGVREVKLSARVGVCLDQAYQQKLPVLLDPGVEAVSPRCTRDTYPTASVRERAECEICATACRAPVTAERGDA